jgi:hypothetical protein
VFRGILGGIMGEMKIFWVFLKKSENKLGSNQNRLYL